MRSEIDNPEDPQCEVGCQTFYGGEVKHHKDCPYYSESLTKMHNDLTAKCDDLIANIAEQS